MKILRVLLIEDEDDEVDRYIKCIGERSDIVLAGRAGTAEEGIAMAKRDRPDAVILDLELNASHGMSFMDALCRRELSYRPAVVVITSTRGPYTIREVKKRGSDRVFHKEDSDYRSLGPHLVFDFLQEICPDLEEAPPEFIPAFAPSPLPAVLTDEEIWNKIGEDLQAHDCPADTKFACYLTDCVFILSSLDKKAPNLKMDVYEPVRLKYNVSSKAVRNGVVYCMEKMWPSIAKEPDAKKLKERAFNGLPELRYFLIYLGKRYRHLWKGRS